MSVNDSYNIFLERLTRIYHQAFPERKLAIKQRNLSSLWISKRFKSIVEKETASTWKKNLKQRSDKSQKTYKIYTFVWKLENSMKTYQKHLNVMKAVIRKSKICNNNFQRVSISVKK